MKFKSGAAIFTADGERVGTLKSVVMTPRSQEVTNLVVERGLLMKEDKVLPLNWVGHTDDENGEIVLLYNSSDFDNLPNFQETLYVSRDGEAMSDEETLTREEALTAAAIPPAYYYTGAPGYFPANMAFFTGLTAMPESASTPRYRTEMVESIPDGTVALPIGAGVYTNNDEQAGSIDEVFTNDHGDVTHFVISKGVLFTTRKLIPTDWIDLVDADGAHLSVTKDVLDRLPDYDAQRYSES